MNITTRPGVHGGPLTTSVPPQVAGGLPDAADGLHSLTSCYAQLTIDALLWVGLSCAHRTPGRTVAEVAAGSLRELRPLTSHPSLFTFNT